jgi:SAM-dependent methyltransferase
VLDAYGTDLAYIHDAGFGTVAEKAAPVLLDRLRRAGWDRGLVVELGCGSGILAAAVSAAGYEVLGFDQSPALVTLARKRAPGARFRVGSFLDAELPPCVAVAAVGECFNYLFDERNTAGALLGLYRRVHTALRPGGLLFCDVAEPGRVPGTGVQRGFREGDGWATLVETEEDSGRRRLTRRITSFRRVGRLYRRGEEVHRLRLVPRAELVEQLRRVGFRVRVLGGYGPLRFPRGWVGVVARKPGQGQRDGAGP